MEYPSFVFLLLHYKTLRKCPSLFSTIFTLFPLYENKGTWGNFIACVPLFSVERQRA